MISASFESLFIPLGKILRPSAKSISPFSINVFRKLKMKNEVLYKTEKSFRTLNSYFKDASDLSRSFVGFIDNKNASILSSSNQWWILELQNSFVHRWLDSQTLDSSVAANTIQIIVQNWFAFTYSQLLTYRWSWMYSLGRFINDKSLSITRFLPTPWFPTNNKWSPSKKSWSKDSMTCKC